MKLDFVVDSNSDKWDVSKLEVNGWAACFSQ